MIKYKKRAIFSILIILLSVLFLIENSFLAKADENGVYLGGMPVGFSITTRGAYIVGFSDVKTDKGYISPAKDAGLRVGDIIMYINDNEVNCAEDVEKQIKNSEIIKINVKRDDEFKNFYLFPKRDNLGKTRIGVFLRSNISGVGTVTYISNNKFASLGHPISDENSNIIDIVGGNIYLCNIIDVNKAQKGKTGELKGSFINKNSIGKVENNKNTGVFGEVYENFALDRLRKINLSPNTAVIGKATIFTTIEGNVPKEYEINIVKIDKGNDRNFVIKITDNNLLSKTGGIVQGMSGSPIIQNGKLVGAITHVFINDPTRGFGIDIANLINQ